MIRTVYTSNYNSRFIIYTIQFTTMASAQIINCIACNDPVRPRQQGLQCDGCFRWHHWVCNTGISLEVYRAAVNEGAEIEWQCKLCQHPDADSTMEDVSLADPSVLPVSGAAAPGSQACINPDTTSVWRQAFPYPEEKVPLAAVEDFEVLGGLQQQWDNSPPSAEVVQFYQWPYHQMLKTEITYKQLF